MKTKTTFAFEHKCTIDHTRNLNKCCTFKHTVYQNNSFPYIFHELLFNLHDMSMETEIKCYIILLKLSSGVDDKIAYLKGTTSSNTNPLPQTTTNLSESQSFLKRKLYEHRILHQVQNRP